MHTLNLDKFQINHCLQNIANKQSNPGQRLFNKTSTLVWLIYNKNRIAQAILSPHNYKLEQAKVLKKFCLKSKHAYSYKQSLEHN